MSLGRVQLVSDVLKTCTIHSLTTDCEEIMGLLLGDITMNEDGMTVCRIWRALPQIRTDRRKVMHTQICILPELVVQDRVEPSHEQLSKCISKAERVTEKTGVRTRVVGWYHSHPNITVQPSHVDLRTQAQHQSLDPGFVGLIISCFNKDQVIKCTAFQTTKTRPNHQNKISNIDIDMEQMDADLNQALRNSMDDYQLMTGVSGSMDGLWSKEIPVKVTRPKEECEYSLMDIAQIYQILATEESQAYQKTMENQRNVSQLISVHQAVLYTQRLTHLMNAVFVPNLNALLTLKHQHDLNLDELKQQIEYYTGILENAKSRTPSPVPRSLTHEHSISRSDLSGLYELSNSSTLLFADHEDADDPNVTQKLPNHIHVHPLASAPVPKDRKANISDLTNDFNEQNVVVPTEVLSDGEFRLNPTLPNNSQGLVETPINRPPFYNHHPLRQPTEENMGRHEKKTEKQHVPFVTYTKPPDPNVLPESSAFAYDSSPNVPYPIFESNQLRPLRQHDNGIGYSAGIRRELPLRTDPPTQPHLATTTRDPEQRLSHLDGTGHSNMFSGQGRHITNVPRIDSLEDLWRDARDHMQRR